MVLLTPICIDESAVGPLERSYVSCTCMIRSGSLACANGPYEGLPKRLVPSAQA